MSLSHVRLHEKALAITDIVCMSLTVVWMTVLKVWPGEVSAKHVPRLVMLQSHKAKQWLVMRTRLLRLSTMNNESLDL